MVMVGQYSKRYARLLRAALGQGRTIEDAEDLVQEAYARLIEYQRNAWIRDEEGFLRRVVRNLAINQYHREQIVTFIGESLEELDTFQDSSPSIERVLSAQQQVAEIAATLSAVSRRTSEIFIAHRAGFRYWEIAEECGISTRTVKKHLMRARLLLSPAPVVPWADVRTCLKGYPVL